MPFLTEQQRAERSALALRRALPFEGNGNSKISSISTVSSTLRCALPFEGNGNTSRRVRPFRQFLLRCAIPFEGNGNMQRMDESSLTCHS